MAVKSSKSFAAPATIKQIDFITTLLRDRQVHPKYAEEVIGKQGQMTKKEASRIIGTLTPLPRKDSGATIVQPGYYLLDDVVYVVVMNKEGTKSYAKGLAIVDGRAKWNYIPGAIRALVNARPLTVEEAVRLGRIHGVCVICGATLTDTKSAEEGIGPVCKKKLVG